MSKMVRLNYTTINHEARVLLGLTINEYCVLDLIHNLASNPKNNQMGWCYAKKETLATYLDLGRATVFRAINKGMEAGLLEKHPEQPALIKATSKWYERVMIRTESQNETPNLKSRYQSSQNDTFSRLKMRTNKDIDKDINNITVEAKNSKRKNGLSSIGEVLNHRQLPLVNNEISHEWQAEALRLWSELGNAGTPTKQFFRHIKLAFKRKQEGKLAVALSYCKDAVNVQNRERLFYWRLANEPI